ncbi:BACON domain-containing carbohydrate-binding protein [uncultured Bacteroides sp.]|uniref:BACON domain-containing protein n=1 Tax=uncultured Bacteroides sp. TaxID=162156 RepID=UPI0025EFEF88|nr:BACON domain-containing carbohydrate-binding protein [uncultured Bacteroides sp.]
MKKNINKLGLVSFLSLIVLMTSCAKDENTSETPTLGLADTEGYLITNGKLSLQGSAASTIMNVISSVDWNITDDADWLDFTPTEGNGNAEVTMTVNENTTPDARTAILTLTNSSGQIAEPVTITVTQISNVTPTLMLDSDELTIISTSDDHEVKVIANVAWDCEVTGDGISGSDDDWLKVKEKGADKLIFSVTENTADDPRNAYIKFFNEEYQLLYTLTVSQLPGLVVTTDDENIGFESQDITINVVSSSTWSYNITGDNTEWLTEKSKSDNQLILTAKKFSRYSISRTATVTISDGSDSKSVTITQKGIVSAELLDISFQENGDAINISNFDITIEKKAGDALTVVTNERFGYGAKFDPITPGTEIQNYGGYYVFEVNQDFRDKVLDGELSIEIYACCNSLPKGAQALFGKVSAPGYAIQFIDNKWNLTLNDGGWRNCISQQYSFESSKWFHVVATHKKNQYTQVYVDGVSINQTKFSTTDNKNYDTNKFCIGAAYRSDTQIQQAFSGTIALVRMYDRILTTDEISGLYEDATSN